MDKKREKRKERKISFRRIFSNNLYLIGVIHRIDPWIVPARFIMSIASAVTWFFSSAYVLQYALNAVSDGKGFFDVIWLIVALLAANLAVNLIYLAFNTLYFNRKYIEISKKMNIELFRQACRMELSCYENPEFYDRFVRAAAEADRRAFDVLDSLTGIVSIAVTLCLSVGLVASIEPLFLLLSLIPLLILPIRSKYHKASFERDNEIRGIDRKKQYPNRVFYVSDYAKELRLTNMATFLFKYFKDSSDLCREIHRKKGGMLTLLEILSIIVGQIVPTLLITAFAVYLTVAKKTMGYGDCIAVLTVTSQISGILLDSVNKFMNVENNALYIDNLREFIEYEPKIKDGDKELPRGDIRLENVSFRYDGAEEYTLKNISMTFKDKQKVAIVGANGAGKSTLIKLILRLYDCEGSITYGGVDIKELKVSEYRDIFSSVMQDYHVFALTAAENVTLSRRCHGDDEKIIDAMKSAGIYDKICADGGDINSLMTREFDDKGIMLSGGEAQKLAISHVYSKENRFVILDEPSSALDPIAEYKMYETMLSACDGCGMIFISHRLSSATLADMIYLIDNGEIAECGTHGELMAKGGKYADMFLKQAESYKNNDGGEVQA